MVNPDKMSELVWPVFYHNSDLTRSDHIQDNLSQTLVNNEAAGAESVCSYYLSLSVLFKTGQTGKEIHGNISDCWAHLISAGTARVLVRCSEYGDVWGRNDRWSAPWEWDNNIPCKWQVWTSQLYGGVEIRDDHGYWHDVLEKWCQVSVVILSAFSDNYLVFRYTGQILMNLMDGKGDFTWPNGDFYSGQYINGRRNGLGDMFYGDGDVYRGAWRNGQYHGQGQYQWWALLL